ncbi:50S ribosomal protein L35-like [Helianthus annuus]|nr:50S ribosomal protein L35-like [Helianthus annuus]
MPINGSVGSYWSHTSSAQFSSPCSSYKGIPNATSKYREASAKRFIVTGTGKIVRRRTGKQHLLRKKNAKRTRLLKRFKSTAVTTTMS